MLFDQALYPILDPDACERAGMDLYDPVARWLDRGMNVFQLRAKGRSTEEYLALGLELAKRFPAARLLANDYAELALSRRDIFRGLHLGQSDWQELTAAGRAEFMQLARENLNRPYSENFLLGYSTHDARQLEAALAGWQALTGETGAEGARESNWEPNREATGMPLWNYVALGPLNATGSKREGLSPVLDGAERSRCFTVFDRIRRGLRESGQKPGPFPFLVGIGGIEASNVRVLLGNALNLSVLPAVIGSGLDLEQLDALIKEVALLPAQNSLET